MDKVRGNINAKVQPEIDAEEARMTAGSRSKGRQDTNIVSATAFVEELYVMLANAAQVHMIRRVAAT